MLHNIYTPAGFGDSYHSILRTLQSVNRCLRGHEGILAPSSSSLDNTRQLYAHFGHPLDSIKPIHIGGTNGKGTVSFKMYEFLRSRGINTGLFVSPHISCFRERMQINGELISKEMFSACLKDVMIACVSLNIPATEFEITFITAAIYFQRNKCEAVVLEVGLGGDLDATNVASTALSIICSVSLDHTQILGTTVEEIAMRKGGIFKPGVPCLIGPHCPRDILRQIAAEVKAPFFTLEDTLTEIRKTSSLLHKNKDNSQSTLLHDDIACIAPVEVEDNSISDTDNLNRKISFAALYLLQYHVGGLFSRLHLLEPSKLTENNSLLSRRPPCRWENIDVNVKVSNEKTVNVKVILDVGHNPAAIAAITRRIKTDFQGQKIRMIYAMSRDKDIRSCLRELLTAVSPENIYFAQSQNCKALSKENLKRTFFEESNVQLEDLGEENTRDLIRKVLVLTALEDSPDSSVVIICGTCYIMPDARLELGVTSERDCDDIKES